MLELVRLPSTVILPLPAVKVAELLILPPTSNKPEERFRAPELLTLPVTAVVPLPPVTVAVLFQLPPTEVLVALAPDGLKVVLL